MPKRLTSRQSASRVNEGENERRTRKKSAQDGSADDDSVNDNDSNPASSDNDSEEVNDEVGAVVVRRRGKSQRGMSEDSGSSRRVSSRATKFASSMKEQSSQDLTVEPAIRKTSTKRTGRRNQSDDDYGSEDSNLNIRRVSSRSTRFTQSMKEPPSESVRDLFASKATQKVAKGTGRGDFSDSDDSAVQPRRRQRRTKASPARKSPAVRRHRRGHIESAESSDEYDESDEESGEEEEELKIQRIIASRSEHRNKWKEICEGMNTVEVTVGSRWEQAPNKQNGDDDIEERFLVKWSGLSFVHVSWETQDDLLDQIEGAKTYLSTFFRKSVNGLLFSQDERCDGDYFDPSFTQIERILAIDFEGKMPQTEEEEDNASPGDFGIVTDRKEPGFEEGLGRWFYIKWSSVPYVDATWEHERDLILNDIEYKDQLKAFHKRSRKPNKTAISKQAKASETELRRAYKIFGDNTKKDEDERQKDVEEYQRKLREFVFPNGGQLRDYQAEGVAWMLSNKVNNRSSILADEMGLGKTIQTATFIDLLINQMHRSGPVLVVVPLSTVSHWQREFASWTCLNAIVYHGSASDRKTIRENEFAFEADRPNHVGANQFYLKKCGKKTTNSWMVQVVITTPEILVADDWMELTAVKWSVLVVDEAHRLKNHNSKLAVNLRKDSFHFEHKVLLTGTPIQNDVKEFWTLLNFIDPEEYDDIDDFLEEYGDMKSKERIDDLHEKIRPYILRRLKEDVEKSVPPKEETLIEVELTILQKQYYRALYEKNVAFLHKNKRKALDGPSLNNLAMQLRKCCNHLFLLNGVEDEARKEQMVDEGSLTEADFLVRGSGKLVLLDKLLPRLKEKGHRILLFSQFKIMLDILEDYLELRSMKFERIDGSITGWKRQQAIDRFQSADGKDPPFVMLLSTRAGGVGINLTAADTVIIFDSDWNPQNDLQAQARCHRIGQTKDVKVYRLLSRKSYEMQMFHMSSLKMGLDQAVLKGFESGSSGEASMTKEEVERLLRHGAYDIFNEEKAGTAERESNDFVQQDIDSILERRSRTVVHKNTGSQSNAAGGTFSKASFKAPKTPGSSEQQTTDEVDIEDPEFWTKMVGAAPAEEIADLGRRKRNQANYSEKHYHRTLEEAIGGTPNSRGGGSDAESTDYSSSDDGSSDDAEPVRERSRWGGSKKNQWKRDQTESLIKVLETQGYGNIAWEELFKLIPTWARIEEKEVKRMCWSLLLLAIWEAARDDASGAKKRAERAAEKRREQDGEDVQDVSIDALKSDDELREVSFRRIWNQNLSWLQTVLEDAVAYARANKARTQDTLDHSKHENKISSLFYSSLWPSLKGRGWKEEAVSHGKHFTYDDNRFTCPREVLNEVPKIHPELTNMVIPVLQKIEASHQHDLARAEEDRSKFLALTTENVDASSLHKFLQKYSPLQLLVDRRSPRKVFLSRRILSACTCMTAARKLVRRAEKDANGNDVIDTLVNLLTIDSRSSKPHPSWTLKHDAVLLKAIAKHGWIDREKSCRAITADSEIKWGEPFDYSELLARQAAEGTEGSGKLDENEFERLRYTADRAMDFLNKHSDLLESMKGCNHDLIVESYCLQQTPEDNSTDGMEDLEPGEWTVDEDMLQQSANGTLRDDTINSGDTEPLDLPAKKDLAKRAKAVLQKSIASLDDNTAVKTVPTVAETISVEYGYPVIDQGDRCCILLAEMIRGLLKPSPSKMPSQLRLLCSVAYEEALALKDMFESSTNETKPKGAEMRSVADQLIVVKKSLNTATRQAKNVVRVMLGLEVSSPRNAAESLFPSKDVIERQSSQKEKKEQLARRDDGALGERFLIRAMKKVADSNNGEPVMFTQDDSPDDEVQLTMVESLILFTFCSEGIPVHLFESKDGGKIRDDVCLTHTLSWSDMGEVLEIAAKDYHRTASDKVKKCEAALKKFDSEEEQSVAKILALRKLEFAKHDESMKGNAAMHAMDFSTRPEKLAKKSIMLMEKIRQTAGSFSASQSKNAHKQENGLGSKVPNWFGKELSKWAKEFDVSDASGKPLSFTTKELLTQNPEFENTAVASILDKRTCRYITCQVALVTRLRAILLQNNDEQASKKVAQAVKCLQKLQDEFEKRPPWWKDSLDDDDSSPGHNLLLLQRLSQNGFLNILSDPKGFGSAEEGIDIKSLRDLGITKTIVQQRANQLVRELHALEESEETMRLLEERRNRAASKKKGSDRSFAECHTSKAASRGAIQTGLHAFFSSTKSGAKKQSVVTLSDSEEKSGSAAKGKRKSGDGKKSTTGKKVRGNNVNGSSKPKGKRKESELSPSSSPEKKQKARPQKSAESDVEFVRAKSPSVKG